MSGLLKCLVWDLDNTIWSGTLLENGPCHLKPGIKKILEELDRRGILLSIASANDRDLAVEVLHNKGLYRLFLHPQISWTKKVSSIQTIAKNLRIGLDSIGFIDDEPFELEQVCRILPSVRIYPAKGYKTLPDRPEMKPEFRTGESSRRREMYIQESVRADTQKKEGMSHRDFLTYCQTRMSIREAREKDLPRILELLHRTHQLNATGHIYDERAVRSFLSHPKLRMYVAELKDRFVDYGKIGVALCACHPEHWEVLSFLLSCRVMTRGIGIFFLSWLQHQAHQKGARELHGHYMRQERNQRMRALYTLSGFRPLYQTNDGSAIFAKKCSGGFQVPDWLTLSTQDR
jgi:FkbH-like protein